MTSTTSLGPMLSINDLVEANRDVRCPFRIGFQEVDSTALIQLNCEYIFRLLPKKRLVCRANTDDRQVLVKLFMGSNADKYLQRELRGVIALQQAGLHTADIIAHGPAAQGIGQVLVLSYLSGTKSLQAQWDNISDQPSRLSILRRVMPLIADMHASGLKQNDIHLNNFLTDKQGKLFVVDGDGVETTEQGVSLTESEIIDNLALLFAQLPPEYDDFVSELITVYNVRTSRSKVETEVLLSRVKFRRHWRLQRYLKKIYRDCTEFVVNHGWQHFYVTRRELATKEWLEFLANPEAYMGTGKRLKSGNTATVDLVEVAGRQVVVKRYNIKNWQHRLSRCWRPSRAWLSWRNGYMLTMLGISTPQPLAMIEERCCYLRGRAYLILDYIAAPDLLNWTQQEGVQEQLPVIKSQLERLFSIWLNNGISHGDLKGNNLLVNEKMDIQVIDLDAMQMHSNQKQLQHYFRKDMQRFLKNWTDSPDLCDTFEPLVQHMNAQIEQLK
ncbi:hypothetical protein KCM76_09625 [Zooshikella marina]|uniref:lipopolysaccharide kinase InaA family protein n=1 Tax=Zooshikella ganghwensis TaxID=202772 RepID=UPI001BAEB63B|nr:lipopolysaccharide kinase InaA family protein [Zooshikella ganghwensis]MBU2706246.1 hypothetical protein [Zooshikella ganghwensis]